MWRLCFKVISYVEKSHMNKITHENTLPYKEQHACYYAYV